MQWCSAVQKPAKTLLSQTPPHPHPRSYLYPSPKPTFPAAPPFRKSATLHQPGYRRASTTTLSSLATSCSFFSYPTTCSVSGPSLTPADQSGTCLHPASSEGRISRIFQQHRQPAIGERTHEWVYEVRVSARTTLHCLPG